MYILNAPQPPPLEANDKNKVSSNYQALRPLAEWAYHAIFSYLRIRNRNFSFYGGGRDLVTRSPANYQRQAGDLRTPHQVSGWSELSISVACLFESFATAEQAETTRGWAMGRMNGLGGGVRHSLTERTKSPVLVQRPGGGANQPVGACAVGWHSHMFPRRREPACHSDWMRSQIPCIPVPKMGNPPPKTGVHVKSTGSRYPVHTPRLVGMLGGGGGC
jgi:hypothetical protein